MESNNSQPTPSPFEVALWKNQIQILQTLNEHSVMLKRLIDHFDLVEDFEFSPIKDRNQFINIDEKVKTDSHFCKALVSDSFCTFYFKLI